MSTYGLTDDGYVAPRAADFLTEIRDEYEASLIALGLPSDIDWVRDVFLGTITANMAARLGSLGSGSEALYGVFDVANATGLGLDNLALIVGVRRIEATYSQALATFTGTAGTAVLTGDLVEGGGTDDDQRWTITEDTVIGGGGTVDVIVRATAKGAVVATTAQIDELVIVRSGLTSVTNAAAATTGDARETDTELRKRRQESLAIGGGRNRESLRAQLTQLAAVTAAVVVDNDTLIATVVDGLVLEPKSVSVVLYPSTLTTAQQEAVALIIYDQVADGIYINGSDIEATVTGFDSAEKIVRWDWASPTTVNVQTTVTLDTGYALGDVEAQIQAHVADYFATLGVGDDVRTLPMLALVATVEGVLGASMALNGGAADIAVTLAQIAEIGTNTVV